MPSHLLTLVLQVYALVSNVPRITWYLPLIFGILHWTLLQNRMIGPWDLGLRLSSLVWGSDFLEYLSHTYLIPSRLTTTISSAYERHLRKPRNKSFCNKYLQELGGETTASLSSAINRAESSQVTKSVPVGLPPELHQCAPEYT
jgi:hypothetical protein